MFNLIDEDGNGSITPQEFQAWVDAEAAMRYG